MGIYKEWAGKYFDSGISTIPCNGKKAPIFNDWSKYCETKPTESEIDAWTQKYSDSTQIGMPLGAANGIVAFDFDYEYDPKKCKITEEEFKRDRQRIEGEIMELLPATNIGKVGMKGWTRFYQYNNKLVNKLANRNNVRLFDFLSTGRQTIIPPSLHSSIEDKKVFYKWIDEDLLHAPSLPKLSMEVIETIISLYSDRPKGQRPAVGDLSRHERIMYYILDALKVDHNLERVTAMTVEYDIKINGTNRYLTDPKYYDTADASKNAQEFVQKIFRWSNKHNALMTKEEKKEESFTPISWDHFFGTAFAESRKDIFSEETFIKKTKTAKWEPIKLYEGVLRSYARTCRLPTSFVVDELDRWAFENTKTEFLCDIPIWDGQDRIDKIAGSMKVTGFTREQVVEIFKHWGVTIFRRVNDSSVQNRCIILKGLQGFGKDTLVRSMLKDFKPYYESTTLPGTPKDVLEIVSRLLVIHIEEFDQTKGMDVGFLKSLITQPTSFFRESYGRTPNSKPMRGSFISTANVDDILRDTTGNRRFIVLPVEEIGWDYPQNESLQVIAQWKSFFGAEMHFKLSDETEAAIKATVQEFTPSNLDESIVELYKARFYAMTSMNGPYPYKTELAGSEIMEMLCALTKVFSCSLRRVQMAIKSKGMSRRVTAGILYYIDPTSILHKKNDADRF